MLPDLSAQLVRAVGIKHLPCSSRNDRVTPTVNGTVAGAEPQSCNSPVVPGEQFEISFVTVCLLGSNEGKAGFEES
jgi:hypothetical protein